MKKFIDLMEWPVAATLLLALGLSAQAQDAAEEFAAPALAPALAPAVEPEPQPEQPRAQPTASSYWIGILGGEVSPALRTHLGLEGAGVLVREVVPGSPAEKAGLKQHDVLLSANGKAVTDMSVLATIVREVGGKPGAKIAIDLLRTGAHQQLTIVPAVRPEAPAVEAPPAAGAIQPALPEGFLPEGMFGDGQPFRFRMFGPGVAVGGADINIQAPGNTSVKVNTKNGQTRIEVTRNGERWEIDGADPESLENLPADLRPMVEGMLNRQQQGVDINVDVQDIIPQIEGFFGGLGERMEGRREERLQRRLEALERQLEAIRGELGAPAAAAVPDGGLAPPLEGGEAPAFEPPAAAEIEIPAEVEEEK